MSDVNDSTIYINAVGIFSGGGRKLLIDLLENLDDKRSYHVFLDNRLNWQLDLPENVKIEYQACRGFKRLFFELSLIKRLKKSDTHICLANVPPLLRSRAKTVMFMQNRQVLQPEKQIEVGLKFKLRLYIRWFLFHLMARNIDHYIVQTRSMREILSGYKNVTVCPVFPLIDEGKTSNSEGKKDYFIYVGDNQVHKNHLNLFRAWKILKDNGFVYELRVTVSESDLRPAAKVFLKENDLSDEVKLLGNLSYNEVIENYSQAKALVFPSRCESFGLPLLEAEKMGLPIIASELDYVRDVCSPNETFDPESPISIYRAIRRQLMEQEKILPAVGPKEFLKVCMESR